MSIYYPQGKYSCLIKQQGFSVASTGTPTFILIFDVVANEHGEPVNQQQRTLYRYITEKTMEYFADDLRNLGLQPSSLTQLDPSSDDPVTCVGREVLLYCKHGTDQNEEPREEWSVAFAQRELKPPPAAAMRSLDLLFGKAIKSKGVAPKPQPAPAATMAYTAPGPDDEACF